MALVAWSSGLLCLTPTPMSYHCWLCLLLLHGLMDVFSPCRTGLKVPQLLALMTDMLSALM